MPQIESIPSIVNGCLDLLALESSVDMSFLIEGGDPNQINMIRKRCEDIIKYLYSTNRAIQLVNKFELYSQSDINWIYNGRREIFTIFKSLGILEYMISQIHDKFEPDLNLDCKNQLDQIRELNLKLKVLINGLYNKMELSNQYHEINECVLKSIDDELDNFKITFNNLDDNFKLVSGNKLIHGLGFNQIRSKLKECELFSLNKNIRFVSLDDEELVIFNKFIDLEKRLNHSIAALKYIPNTIEMFLNNAKQYYPNEVLEFVERYTSMIRNVSNLRNQLNQFQNKFITTRMNQVFQRILELIGGVMGDESKRDDVLEMISVLNSIKDICCIGSDQRQKFGLISNRFASPDEVINYRPQSRLNRRVFSNPISNDVNLANITISEEFNEEIKLIEMIRLEANDLARELKETDKLRDLTNRLSNLEIPMSETGAPTPSYTHHSSNLSSPEQITAKDIFDTDPFVTPSGNGRRGIRTSKIPVISPSTTPKTNQFIKSPVIAGNGGMTSLLNFNESKVIVKKPVRQSQIPLPKRIESIQDIMKSRKRSPSKIPVFKTESRYVLEQRANAISLPKGKSNGYRITTL